MKDVKFISQKEGAKLFNRSEKQIWRLIKENQDNPLIVKKETIRGGFRWLISKQFLKKKYLIVSDLSREEKKKRIREFWGEGENKALFSIISDFKIKGIEKVVKKDLDEKIPYSYDGQNKIAWLTSHACILLSQLGEKNNKKSKEDLTPLEKKAEEVKKRADTLSWKPNLFIKTFIQLWGLLSKDEKIIIKRKLFNISTSEIKKELKKDGFEYTPQQIEKKSLELSGKIPNFSDYKIEAPRLGIFSTTTNIREPEFQIVYGPSYNGNNQEFFKRIPSPLWDKRNDVQKNNWEITRKTIEQWLEEERKFLNIVIALLPEMEEKVVRLIIQRDKQEAVAKKLNISIYLVQKYLKKAKERLKPLGISFQKGSRYPIVL